MHLSLIVKLLIVKSVQNVTIKQLDISELIYLSEN